jgi:hypothetical protein
MMQFFRRVRIAHHFTSVPVHGPQPLSFATQPHLIFPGPSQKKSTRRAGFDPLPGFTY